MKISVTVAPEAHTTGPWIFAGSLSEGIRKAAAFGFDAVELHLRDPLAMDVPALQTMLAAARVPVSGIATGMAYGLDGLSFSSKDADIRRKAVARIKSHIDVCRKLHAIVLIGQIRGKLSDDANLRESQMQWIDECTRETDAYAQGRGVRLALEPINRYESNYLHRVEDILDLIHRNDLKASGVLLDTFHMNIEERSIEEAVRMAAGSIAYVHLPDSNRRAPGWGHLDLGTVVRGLRDAGYDGYLGMEMLPLPDPEGAARQALATVRRLLAESLGYGNLPQVESAMA